MNGQMGQILDSGISKALFYPVGTVQPTAFRKFNSAIAWLHIFQFFAVIAMNELKFKKIPPNRVFVSSTVNLTFPNHMLHVYDGSARPTPCSDALDLINSERFQSHPHLNNADLVIRGVADSILFDMRNTTTVEFYINQYSLNIPYMVMLFFLLSGVFQMFNGWYIDAYPNGPRYIQYVEYSLSASLTIVIMALNTGIQDLITILSMFALFFGMNIFGVLAEFMMHAAENCSGNFQLLSIGQTHLIDFASMWLIPHLCGWVLFLFAWLPVVIKYTKMQACSENSQQKGVPSFIAAAVAMESLCYFLFGLLQLLVLTMRTNRLGKSDSNYLSCWLPCVGELQFEWKHVLDVGTTTLSLVAKTFLAWALLGPALVART